MLHTTHGRRHRTGRRRWPAWSSTRTGAHAAYLVPLCSGLVGVLAARRDPAAAGSLGSRA